MMGATSSLDMIHVLHDIRYAAPPPPKKTRSELSRDADPTYYGFRDEEDGVLVPLERAAEERGMLARMFEQTVWPIVLLLEHPSAFLLS